MNILILNLILSTSEKGVITRRRTNANTMIYNMARGFVALGHEVTLVAMDEFRPLEPEDNRFEVVYFKSSMPSLFKPDLLPKAKGLRKWLKRNTDRFDVVISSELFSLATLTAARVCPEKLLVWHELSVMQRALFKIPSRLWYHAVVPMFMRDVRVVARSTDARSFVSRFCRNVSHIIADHGSDPEVFYPGDDGDTRDAFIIVSQLVPRKNIGHIVDVFADFVRRPGYGHWQLDICGDGAEREALEKRVKEQGIEANVKFHGYCTHEQWAPLGRTAKGMLIDTLKDNNMVTVSECLCMATPVLMNTVPTIATLVRECGAGIVDDGWTADHLERMATEYPAFRKAALAVAPTLTSTACAAKLLDSRTK